MEWQKLLSYIGGYSSFRKLIYQGYASASIPTRHIRKIDRNPNFIKIPSGGGVMRNVVAMPDRCESTGHVAGVNKVARGRRDEVTLLHSSFCIKGSHG